MNKMWGLRVDNACKISRNPEIPFGPGRESLGKKAIKSNMAVISIAMAVIRIGAKTPASIMIFFRKVVPKSDYIKK